MNVLKAMFGNYSKREVKRLKSTCNAILALEEPYKKLSDAELKNQTKIITPIKIYISIKNPPFTKK